MHLIEPERSPGRFISRHDLGSRLFAGIVAFESSSIAISLTSRPARYNAPPRDASPRFFAPREAPLAFLLKLARRAVPWDVFLIFDTSVVTFVLPFVRRYSASALAVHSRVNARRSLARAKVIATSGRRTTFRYRYAPIRGGLWGTTWYPRCKDVARAQRPNPSLNREAGLSRYFN